MTEVQPHEGHPVQIVVSNENRKFELKENLLSEIFEANHVGDKPVVVISVAGALRTGKSFLLNFILGYLRAKGSEDWLDGAEEACRTGFEWMGGDGRVTTGLWVWSEVFLMDTLDGEVAVLLMDTQGAFDSYSTVRECATMFALSAMLSSVQIFNLSRDLNENDLQHLQVCTEYGKLALGASDDKPFQKLMFLIRDWHAPFSSPFGEHGGQQICDKRLACSTNQTSELWEIRKGIKACFTSVSGFLLPYPGQKVATDDPSFRGRLADIDSEFKSQLQLLMPLLLAPSNIVVKELNGSKITTKQLPDYFKSYVAKFQGSELPEPKSLFEATAQANHVNAFAAAKLFYEDQIKQICSVSKPYIQSDDLNSKHEQLKRQAVQQFTSKKKMGGAELENQYKIELEKEIDDIFIQFKESNDSKHRLEVARQFVVTLGPPIAMSVACGLNFLQNKALETLA